MECSLFEEAEFFRAIATSGARALLIGRRALIALGIPVLTVGYDFCLHIDDIPIFNAAIDPMAPKDFEDIRLLQALSREEPP